MGVINGLAYVDFCGNCVEGTSDLTDCCSTLDAILSTVHESEGSTYTGDPDDPGGKTKYGIAWNTWTNYSHIIGKSPTVDNLKNLTADEADEIYSQTFWVWSQADNINDGDLRKMYFDFFVHGPSSAVNILQETVKALGYEINVDGRIGSDTWNAVNLAISEGKIIQFYNTFKDLRIEYYRDQASQKHLDGWLNRANKFQDKTTENSRGVAGNV
jgi:lysozyme family protein